VLGRLSKDVFLLCLESNLNLYGRMQKTASIASKEAAVWEQAVKDAKEAGNEARGEMKPAHFAETKARNKATTLFRKMLPDHDSDDDG